jgi:Domain of unknown function (DUF222)
MPAPTPEPGPDEEQPRADDPGTGRPSAGPGPDGERPPAGGHPSPKAEKSAQDGADPEAGRAQRRGGPGWASGPGSAGTGPVAECEWPVRQLDALAGDGLPAGLDYAALVEALAVSGALGSDCEDQDAEFAEWLAAEAEGRLEPADPARVAALALEHMGPGAAQAGWLEVAAATVERLDENALAGVAIAARQLASRAQAAELAAVAQITARAAAADRRIGVEAGGRPARVCRDAVGQVELALMLTHYQAEAWADLAVTLAWRLPATGAALARGAIDLDRAKLIAEVTSVLTQEQARAVEEKILPSAGGLTRPYLRERLARAVIAADPEGAERRREQAERQAKVSLYGDEDGTATLAGSKLPAVHAAAAMARITAIARAMKAAGQAGGLDLHRAQVMIGLLLGTLPCIPPAEGAPPDQPPPDPDPGPGGPAPDGGPGHDDGGCGPDHADPVSPDDGSIGRPAGPGDGPGGGGPGGPAGSGSLDRGLDDGGLDDGGLDDGGLDDGGPDGRGPDGRGLDGGRPWDDLPAPRDEDAPPDDGIDDHRPDHEQDQEWGRCEEDDDRFETGPVPAWPALGAIPPALACRTAGLTDGRPVPGLLDAVLPWATLLGLSQAPGTLGRIGPITAAQARQLAQTAEADPAAQWRVIVTNPAGQAIALTRIPRPRRRGRDRAGPGRRGPNACRDGPSAGPGLVGRVTVTITEDTVTAFGQAGRPRGPGPPGSGSSAGSGPPGGSRSPGGPGPPGGIAAAALRAATRALAKVQARAEGDAAGGCAHSAESAAYRPPPRLREYVIARDVTCRSAVCRQPAWRADLDHTKPWDQGGRTCPCNLGGGCRRDHQLKQHPRWKLEQTAPGVFRWTTPAGRTYTVRPDTYPV